MNKERREEIELSVMDVFNRNQTAKLLTKEMFQALPQYANADLVRAFEDLEKRWRLLTRYTKEGSDWVTLTPDGAEYAGVSAPPDAQFSFLHPPRSIT